MFPRGKWSLFSTPHLGGARPCSWLPTGLATPPASSLPSAYAVEEQDGGGGCPEMGEVPERMPEGRKDRKEGCPTRCLNARALAPVRVLTLPVARGPSG